MPPNDTAKDTGWDWFEADGAADGSAELAVAFARCFRGADGDRVLDHLKARTLDRVLGPDATDAELRDIEGQRRLVAAMLALVARGRAPGAPA